MAKRTNYGAEKRKKELKKKKKREEKLERKHMKKKGGVSEHPHDEIEDEDEEFDEF